MTISSSRELMSRQLIINGETLTIKKTKKMIKIKERKSKIQWRKIYLTKARNKLVICPKITKIHRKEIGMATPR